ncbi:MAG TPA: hypothetical protein VI078_10690, partial [bacterium]
MTARYADVALRLALPEALQFAIPEELRGRVRPGQRVLVPLRGGRDVGYVVGLSDEPKVQAVRPIERLLDAEPQLPADVLELILAVSRHYLAPVGLVLRAAVPRSVHYEGTAQASAAPREVLVATVAVPVEEAETHLPALARRAP